MKGLEGQDQPFVLDTRVSWNSVKGHEVSCYFDSNTE